MKHHWSHHYSSRWHHFRTAQISSAWPNGIYERVEPYTLTTRPSVTYRGYSLFRGEAQKHQAFWNLRSASTFTVETVTAFITSKCHCRGSNLSSPMSSITPWFQSVIFSLTLVFWKLERGFKNCKEQSHQTEKTTVNFILRLDRLYKSEFPHIRNKTRTWPC